MSNRCTFITAIIHEYIIEVQRFNGNVVIRLVPAKIRELGFSLPFLNSK